MVRFTEGGTVRSAVQGYAAVARKAGVSLVHLALKWCLSRWYAPTPPLSAHPPSE